MMIRPTWKPTPMGRLIDWIKWLFGGGAGIMNRDEFIAESKRLQAEYGRKLRRDRAIYVGTAVVVLCAAFAFLLLGCQMPLRQ